MIQHYDGQDYCLRCGGPANSFSCPQCDGVEYTGHYWTPSEEIDPYWDDNEPELTRAVRLGWWLGEKKDWLTRIWKRLVLNYLIKEEEIPF